ncbi:MAG: polysaccharide deacetylase family protein [Solirubrobacterales bacterium]|nr:polysaccharide deacetylase family protein [Solirubrobacterales bacterium]
MCARRRRGALGLVVSVDRGAHGRPARLADRRLDRAPPPRRPARRARPRVSSERPERGSAARRHRRRRALIRRRRLLAVVAATGAIALVAWALASGGNEALITSQASGAHPTLAERETAALDELLDRSQFIVRGSDRKPEVALTFDDGPGPYTPEIVEILADHHAKATFFTVGNMQESFSASTREQLRRGDALGSHTNDHARMATLTPLEQRAELDRVDIALREHGISPPRLFRPPNGSYDDETLELLSERKMLMVLWSVDTGDYLKPGTDVIVERALAGAEPGAIILMHDAGGDRSQTVAALPEILRGLRERGLRPVTIPRLILDNPPPRDQELPENLDGSLDAVDG